MVDLVSISATLSTIDVASKLIKKSISKIKGYIRISQLVKNL